MRKSILKFYQPEEGSFDMGYDPAYGFEVFQDGEKFFREDLRAGVSGMVTRGDGSVFISDSEPWKGRGEEISREAVEKMMMEAKDDRKYTILCPLTPASPSKKKSKTKKTTPASSSTWSQLGGPDNDAVS